MTLTGRLNLFFLAALATVLAGFSVALYSLAHYYLYSQADERLNAALSVLTGAIEVAPDGIEWEPSDRQLAFAAGSAGNAIAWSVTDPLGHVVDRGGATDASELLAEVATQPRDCERKPMRWKRAGAHWQFLQHWVDSPNPIASPQREGDKERKYAALGIAVAVPLDPVRNALQQLAVVLLGLNIAILIGAAIVGRAISRRALRPVTQMAMAANAMDAAALDERLPLSPSGDELEELARAFNGLLERVQVAFERQQRFTGDASHQLRTPLAALLGQVEVALRRERSCEEYKRVLASVSQQGERLQRIVESLLFLARADAEAQIPEREELDLALWITDHLATWKDHPRFEDIAPQVRSACVEAHAVLLGELLNILLDNAFKHSASGTPVAIRIDRSNRAVELSVEDAGCGISEEDLPHVFEPFFRSQSSRLRGLEGCGLGLAVAKRIADAFAGTLSVTSQLGRGSRFALRLSESRKGIVE